MVKLVFILIFAVLFTPLSHSQADTPASPDGTPYDIGAPTLRDVIIDPIHGNDQNDGSAGAPLRTLDEGWRQVPRGEVLTEGVRFILRPGNYTASTLPTYWESRYGTADAPIIITSESQAMTVQLANVNLYDSRYVYFIDVTMVGGGDVFHCEKCDHILLRDVVIRGDNPDTYNTQETIKFNQSQWVYIENSDIGGAWDNAIDMVAVQYGQLIDSQIHNAGDWCMYVKGGSHGWHITRNEFYDCGTGGFTAGQGTGFEFMTPPWLTYEATDISFVANLIHHTEGAAFGVNGGENILIAHNIAYRVGARSHVLEVAHGIRSCDGNTDQCASHLAMGGWGPSRVGIEVFIPNRDVSILNNIIVNPPDAPSQWQHLFIAAPRDPSPINQPAPADEGLRIVGNIIINGDETHPLGIEEGGACADSHPTCNAAQLQRDNAINTFSAILTDPENEDFSLITGVSLPFVPVP